MAEDERSYHIFYQGLASAHIRDKYRLTSANPADYGFLRSATNTYTIQGVNDAEGYELTMACMRSLGFSEEEIDSIWQIIVAILNLGNVNYRVDASNDEAYIKDDDRANVLRAAELLQLPDAEQLIGALETKVVKYPGQVIATRYQLNEAIPARNSCAKTIYGKLFNWIVGKINANIEEKMNTSNTGNPDTINSLGILDIFGFESFKKNSFE